MPGWHGHLGLRFFVLPWLLGIIALSGTWVMLGTGGMADHLAFNFLPSYLALGRLENLLFCLLVFNVVGPARFWFSLACVGPSGCQVALWRWIWKGFHTRPHVATRHVRLVHSHIPARIYNAPGSGWLRHPLHVTCLLLPLEHALVFP